MNHQHVHKKMATTVATSLSSILFSIIASSHHWLHVGILFLLGSSTNMMATMSGVLWVRRTMIIATFITAIYSGYRLSKHKHMPVWMKVMTSLSVLISFGFVIYTLYKFGW
ncbi:hypothetical protein [Aneurinibacillus tyrosinisolvens]|uniref:hypothetical protein n=1 Tax=Aneurinibacillus tyrosinisolvens TaxID=1443435 RepID=UPI00069B792E|nr:hypothetical protein [Aneurinibacillus tyrosinisolvens]